MPQSNDGRKTFLAGEALARGVRVKMSAAETVVACGAGEKGIGFTMESAAINTFVTIRLDHWSVEALASGSITWNNDCYAAASGDVSATISGPRVGIALESASDTELFEMMVACVNS